MADAHAISASEDRPALLFTVCQAAEVLSVSRSTAYRLIDSGELEVVRIGRSVRVPVAAVVEFVDRLRSGTAGWRSSPVEPSAHGTSEIR